MDRKRATRIVVVDGSYRISVGETIGAIVRGLPRGTAGIEEELGGDLTQFWLAGAKLARPDRLLVVEDREEAYDQIAEVRAGLGARPLVALSWIGHGAEGRAEIAGKRIRGGPLGRALGEVDRASTSWFRMCSCHGGEAGAEFACEIVTEARLVSVGHCVVVAAPNPLRQGAICALRPSDLDEGGPGVWWRPDGEGLRACSTFRVNVPDFAYHGGRP